MPEFRTKTMTVVLGAGLVCAAGWYAAGPMETGSEPEQATEPASPETNPTGSESASRNTLDRSVFDVVLWHEPPPPPAPEPERPTAVVQAAPPPQVDLLAITSTPEGFEAVFYDKGSDRLHTVKANDPLGSYRVNAIGSIWVRLDFNGRETTLNLDQPRIAAREGEVTDE
jgi:hypothetical protein